MKDALIAVLLVLLMLVAGIVIALVAEPSDEAPNNDGARLDCVTGEAAQNPTTTDGQAQLRQEFFETVAEAKAFLCVDLPQIQEPGWQVRRVSATRSHSLDTFAVGAFVAGDSAFKSADFYYIDEETRTSLITLGTSSATARIPGSPGPCMGLPPVPPRQGTAQQVDISIRGVDATLWLTSAPSSSQPRASVCWEHQGLFLFVGLTYQPGIDVETEMLELLESIE